MLKKLESIGIHLNINIRNVIELIDSICDWALKIRRDFEELIESVLLFLDYNNFNNSEIAKKTLQVHKEYFIKKFQ